MVRAMKSTKFLVHYFMFLQWIIVISDEKRKQPRKRLKILFPENECDFCDLHDCDLFFLFCDPTNERE